MKITFCGSEQTISGHQYLIELAEGSKMLLDCGILLETGQDANTTNELFSFDPTEIDYVILSNAEIAHSGLLPKLVREGFRGKIYATEATYQLCKLILLDYIQDIKNRINTDEKKHVVKSLYSSEEVEKCFKYFIVLEYNREVPLSNAIRLIFTYSGASLGSASTNLSFLEKNEWKKLHYAGQIGKYGKALLKDPATFPPADILILSTPISHTDLVPTNQNEIFRREIYQTCIETQKDLVIETNDLSSLCEMIYLIDQYIATEAIPQIPIHSSCTLVSHVANLFIDFSYLLTVKAEASFKEKSDPFGLRNLAPTSAENLETGNNDSPCIIFLPKIMTEEEIKVKTNCETIGKVISSNAFDKDVSDQELIQYLSCQDPKKPEKTILIGGCKNNNEALKEKLNQIGFKNIVKAKRGKPFSINW